MVQEGSEVSRSVKHGLGGSIKVKEGQKSLRESLKAKGGQRRSNKGP